MRDGYVEVAPGSGAIVTKQTFGDVQLHIEWATPPTGEGQERGKPAPLLLQDHGNPIRYRDIWVREIAVP